MREHVLKRPGQSHLADAPSPSFLKKRREKRKRKRDQARVIWRLLPALLLV
jgi:hypothetical protein